MTNDGSACAVGPDKVVYRTAVRSTEDGRSGLVQSDDGQLDLALALPKELGGYELAVAWEGRISPEGRRSWQKPRAAWPVRRG